VQEPGGWDLPVQELGWAPGLPVALQGDRGPRRPERAGAGAEGRARRRVAATEAPRRARAERDMAETAFSQEHPYVGVFFFLSMMGVMAFVTFYRFGYISSQVRVVPCSVAASGGIALPSAGPPGCPGPPSPAAVQRCIGVCALRACNGCVCGVCVCAVCQMCMVGSTAILAFVAVSSAILIKV